ncbi:MAG TPA: histidine kinase dimerization/phospho-acceptor domain-containing protein [Bacteroidales bacterium]|nr:histidine kinase dimerization/phospho-acceptor domain-containing protein [Bacteroidales bacterium]
MEVPERTSSFGSLCTWIFENADFGIIITDNLLRITDTNSWVQSQSGKSYDEMNGKNILDVFPEIGERNLSQYLDQAVGGAYVILSARFHRYFLKFNDDSGEMKQTVRISPMLKEDLVTGLIIHIEDVTERFIREEQMHKKNEELQKLNSTKDKFFRIIAHDLRSPFTALLGFSEILRDNYENTSEQTRKEIIDTLHQAIKNQFSLLENLLKWSQLQTGHFELNFTETNLSDIIKNIFSIAQPVVLSKQFNIVRDEVSEDVVLNTDRQALTSVLYNLVFNALKFTESGGYN